MQSTNSFARWTRLWENVQSSFYVNFEKIKKRNEYVYYWQLGNFLNTHQRILVDQSTQTIFCKLLRYKSLSYSFHKVRMGKTL